MDNISVCIATPTGGLMRSGYVSSLVGLVGQFAASKHTEFPSTNISVGFDMTESANWISNREILAERCMREEDDYIFFIDDDMAFAPKILETMLLRKKSVVVTNYLVKTPAADTFVAVDMNDTRVRTNKDTTGIIPIKYSGFGAALIHTQVFKDIPQPWFLPEFVPNTPQFYSTEDNPFFDKVHKAGYTVWLDHDASKMVSHIGTKYWHWHEANG